MKNFLFSLCLIFSILLGFFSNMMNSSAYFVGELLFAIPGFVFLFLRNNRDLKLFVFVGLLSSILNIVVSTTYGIGGSIVFLVVCCITYLCLMYLEVFFTTTLFICLLLLVFLFNQLFVLGTDYRDIFIDYGLSPNYPGGLLVMFNCLWAIWKYLHYKKLPFILPIVSSFIAIFLDGRTSLACMILITLFCFLDRGKKLAALLTILLIVFITYFWKDIVNIYELTTFASDGLESERYGIWKSYLSHLDFVSFIFGLDTQELPFLKDYSGNPHNSFLMYHRRLGLLGVSILLYYIFKGIVFYLNRKMFVVLFFYFILLIRLFFDGMLMTTADYFILTFLFIPLCYNNETFGITNQINTHGNNRIGKIWDNILVLI